MDPEIPKTEIEPAGPEDPRDAETPAPPSRKGADTVVAGMIGVAVVITVIAAVAELTSRGAPEVEKALKRVAAFPITLEQIREAKLSEHVARWWEALEDGSVKCGLCPFHCTIPKNERGVCKVRANIGGKLLCLTYARPLAATVDPIEKKPLFHVLPGANAYSIATAGCNLGCVFCQNWEISQAFPEKSRGFHASPERIVRAAVAKRCETIAYTYTEPTVFFEYMVDTARLAKKKGLKNLWITCGYINPEPLEELCEVLDAANVDLKGFDEGFYRQYCKGTLPPVLRTLETLKAKGVLVEVTNLLVPDANDDPQMIRRMCEWIRRRLGEETPLHFSRFHGDYLLKDRPRTPPETLRMAARIAREAGLKHVYLGNIRLEDGETTFCPHCGKRVVERRGFEVTSLMIARGRCAYCNGKVHGIWE
ncbi:MAG: AmmeMemoRadiSam system radical SAM enzyme [Planctomycetota bacterium]|jgi:pyruvate formate lyase activating enzyme